MEISGIHLGRRIQTELDELLVRATRGDLSYGHVGSSLSAGSPPGLPDRRSSKEIDGDLAVAASALRSWAPHRGIHGRVVPDGVPIEAGATLLVVAPFGPFEMAVPNRIVSVVDEDDRYGFAYGTLAGHAEVGEESFLAEQIAPGRLRLTIRVHAGPATRLARLGAPVVTALQRAAVGRYLDAWAGAVTDQGI